MKETENFHHPAGTPLEPTGEQTEWKTREHPSSQTTVLSPQTPSMMIERIDVDHTWVTDEEAPSHRYREERDTSDIN